VKNARAARRVYVLAHQGILPCRGPPDRWRASPVIPVSPVKIRRRACRFFLAIVCPIGHNTSVPRKSNNARDDAPERLTALYHQLQGVMPLLQEMVQAANVEEGTALYSCDALDLAT
jgi:hypothetical protein